MGNRKFFSFLLSIILVVSTFFSVSMADEEEEERRCTTPSGITLTISSEYTNVIWPGMDEDDPLLELYGIEKDTVVQMYEKGGTEFQCGKLIGDNGAWLFIIIFEMDIPYDLNKNFDVGIRPMYGECFGTTDMFEYGMVEREGIPYYKIAFETSGQSVLRLNQYSLITGSGKMHQINFMMHNDPGVNPDGFTDEDYREFYETTEGIMRSIELSEELASDAITPEGAEPFTGEEPVFGHDYTLLSGITITLPSDMEDILWTGMDDDDPRLAEYGVDKDSVMKMYELGGIELQGYYSLYENGPSVSFVVIESDAPSDLSQIPLQAPDIFESKDILKQGLLEIGGIPMIRTTFQSFQDGVGIKSNQYTFLTGSGTEHDLCFMMMNEGIDSFTDEETKMLDELSESIINSIVLSEELASDVVTPEGFEPLEEITAAPSASPETHAAENTSKKSFFQAFTSYDIPTYTILIALALLLLLGCKSSKLHEWQEEPLSLDKSKAIQGFAAVAIIVHHLSQELAEQAGAIGCFQELGVLFVGIFFFFSGYGLYTSLKTKENYLKGFLKKRLVTILVPFYMCILVFTVASCICGTKYKPLQLLYTLSGWSLINTHMWYIVEIAILYLAFFLIFRLIKNRTAATIVMSLFVIAMMAGSLLLAHGKDMSCSFWFQGEWWYNSSFLFVIGIIFSKHSDGLRRIARKGYVILLPVFAVLTIVLGKQDLYMLRKYSYWSEIPGQDPAYLDKIRCLSVQLPWIIIFVCFILLLMMKFSFGNPVLKFLGSISLELYLIHNLFLTGLRNGTVFRVKSPCMYIILTIMLSIGLATVIHGVDKYLIGLISGKKKTISAPALKTSSHIHSIDVMRIVMAFLVVAIHFPFDGKAGNVFITYGKTAVPFFLVICGYFLYREDSKEMMKRLLKQTKRIFIFFVASNVFYAGFYAIYLKMTTGSYNGMKTCFTRKAIMDFLLYNFSPFSEHLWYLGSLLYALLILLLLNKCKALKVAMFAGPLLVAAYVVLSHLGIGESYQLRNALLVGLGYTMMGMLIRRFEKKILDHKATAPILWIIFLICCATAIVELNHYKQGVAVPFISCEILVYVIALLCLKYPDFGKDTFAEWLGRECSLPVYILHIAVMYSMVMTKNDGFFGRYGAVTVFVVTTVIAALYKSIKNAITDRNETETDKKQPAVTEVK